MYLEQEHMYDIGMIVFQVGLIWKTNRHDLQVWG